jgi:hypothetical protein
MPPRSNVEDGQNDSAMDTDDVQSSLSKVTCNASSLSLPSPSSSLLLSIVPKKRVSFFGCVHVHPVLHINDYFDSEVADTWYDKEELNSIRESCRRTIASMEEDGSLLLFRTDYDDEVCCQRGLENRTRDASRRKLQFRIAAWDAVLDEQEQQRLENIVDPERMAHWYHYYAVPCEQMAFHMAQLDAAQQEAAVSQHYFSSP